MTTALVLVSTIGVLGRAVRTRRAARPGRGCDRSGGAGGSCDACDAGGGTSGADRQAAARAAPANGRNAGGAGRNGGSIGGATGGSIGGATGGSIGGAAGRGGQGGPVTVQPWPSSDAVVAVDSMNQFSSNLSDLVYQPSAGGISDVLWGVQNDPSVLYCLLWSGATWSAMTDDGWTNGKALHYPDGTGSPDAEGPDPRRMVVDRDLRRRRAQQQRHHGQPPERAALRLHVHRDVVDRDRRVEPDHRLAGRRREPGPGRHRLGSGFVS